MTSIKKVKIFSLAKFQMVLFGLMGLMAGIIYSFGGLLIDTLVSLEWMQITETSGLSQGTILAFGALIGMPIIFASIGFILGIVEAILFNFFNKWINGINLEHE